MMQVRSIGFDDLDGQPYQILGTGGFTLELLSQLKAHHQPLPISILNPHDGGVTDMEGIAVVGLAQIQPDLPIVLGSDVFQPQLIGHLQRVGILQATLWDLSDIVQCVRQHQPQVALSRENMTSRYMVMFTVGASVPISAWMGNFRAWLNGRGIELIARHPLDLADDHFLKNAQGLLAWNGSSPLFDPLKTQLQRLGLSLTYAECGFFPQKEHFYFDRAGVNLASQLWIDDLSWLEKRHEMLCCERRNALFGDLTLVDKGYLFVPLQIESDSNIQLYSRFKQGMQEYIDWIAIQEPDLPILFKPHPKDPNPERYQMPANGTLTSDDTLMLIAQSSRVRGITSSVLFEAALLGKEVSCDGQSLLNHPYGTPLQVVTALISRQYHREETEFLDERFERFTHFAFKE
ncbi:MAG: hypothetical protein CENE_01566 [Candidatus Celerinatantimonas neptuna]|nr:MAG: hypothetical protein CENE_01566 [Candidatus Celerinatantimonas neptuna]